MNDRVVVRDVIVKDDEVRRAVVAMRAIDLNIMVEKYVCDRVVLYYCIVGE